MMDESNRTATRTGGIALDAALASAGRESRLECFPAMDHLAASIVHDLRNPLAAICGCAEMLLDADLDSVQSKRLSSNIHRAASRMHKLLTDLACIARGHAGATERCNLRAILAASCESAGVAERDGIEIFVDVPARIEIPLERARMERVFLNLIENAMEAMPGGGTIRIAANEAGNCVLIDIEDNGPGIPAEIHGRLFEPFVTAGKKEGLGLGLALARQTVREHGGDLWSEPAVGARFVISLPVCRQNQAHLEEWSFR